jgi:hypothetical protein
MKKFFLLFPFLLTYLFVTAQVLTVSEEIPLSSDVGYEVLGEMGNHLLLFRDRKTEFEIQAFNAQMREAWSKELVLDRRLPNVLGVVPSQEDFTLIYSYRQKGNTLIKAHRYDPAANLVDSSLLINLGYLFFTPRFELIRSEDRSKLLMYYVENQDIVHTYAFDLPTQSMVWEHKIPLNDFLFGRDFVQAIVDNRGQASFIFQKDNFRSKRKDHFYQIHTYNGSQEPSLTNIPMQEYLTYDVFFEADNLNNQIVAAGLYAEDNSERAMGFFYLSHTPRKSAAPQVTFTAFSDEFLQNLLGRDYREGKGLNETSVRELVLRRDGGALLVAERNKQLQRRTSSTSRVYYDPTERNLVDFYYEEVFVLSIHPDGALHWETILHKKQYSQDDNGIFSSYFLFETPGRLRFLFNDEIRFENTVSEYVINGLGEYDRNSLFSTTKLDIRLRFRAAIQISPSELVIPSERRNRLKLVRLSY